MNKQKRLGIVAAATVVFGIFSKWLVGVPYMAWGYFDKIFVASFLLWCFYAAALYIAAKLETDKKLNFLKIAVQALVFGILAAFVKMGIDAGIEQCAKKMNNMLYVTMLMECRNHSIWKPYDAVFICLCRKKSWDKRAWI